MSRTPSAFRQQDVTRALRAADAAGLTVYGYEVDAQTGTIKVKTNRASENAAASAAEQPADNIIL
jgi:hypothetical protein